MNTNLPLIATGSLAPWAGSDEERLKHALRTMNRSCHGDIDGAVILHVQEVPGVQSSGFYFTPADEQLRPIFDEAPYLDALAVNLFEGHFGNMSSFRGVGALVAVYDCASESLSVKFYEAEDASPWFLSGEYTHRAALVKKAQELAWQS